MEAGAFAEELTCAVCLQVYQDPVILPCQHSFCLKCINDVWVHAAGSGGINCPQCRRKFNTMPSLQKNFTLRNIVEKYNQSQTAAERTPVLCEYCIESPSPAVKTCLKCETSFCTLHLKPHWTKKTYKDHTLIEPIADLTTRQCLDHKKVLEFYCEEDEACVCISCTVIGKHKSHTLLSLDQAKAKIKEKLKKEVQNLHRVQKNCSIKQQDLKKSETEIKTITTELKGNLSKKFSEWRKQLEEDEKYALKLIDKEELRVLSQIRSCSESQAKKMKQIQLIDDEAKKQLQRDCLSFIQNSKQLLSRFSPFSIFQDTVAPHSNDFRKAISRKDVRKWNAKPQFQQEPRVSLVQDSYFLSSQTGAWGKNQYRRHQQATRDTTDTQNITLNLTNVFELIRKKMEESKKYQSAILAMLYSEFSIPGTQRAGHFIVVDTSSDEDTFCATMQKPKFRKPTFRTRPFTLQDIIQSTGQYDDDSTSDS